ncbi:MAG: hypothetical protein D6767_11060 [Candidatus Hydrogenedentota bacterium]|nr:MAG: hypothetical protein D6767_11060 [Candidatus Hydrogenedentota bacterium]
MAIRITVFVFFSFSLFARSYEVHAFRGYNTLGMQKMLIIGQVASRTMINEVGTVRLLNYDTRQMVLTAKVYEWKNLRLGDKIYILEKDPDHNRYKNALIVAEAEIYSIFKTEFQGWMLKARGNLSMVKKGQFIAIPYNHKRQLAARQAYKTGEMLQAAGREAEAFREYRKSFNTDSQNPEIWFQMAEVSRKRGLVEEEGKYLEGAWKRFTKFTDAEKLLALPGQYLRWQYENKIKKTSDDFVKLKTAILFRKKMEYFQQRLPWFYKSFSRPVLHMLQKKGIPDKEFQLYLGKIYDTTSEILDRHSLEKILASLKKGERKILYKPIYLPYMQEKFAYPRKSWNLAYLKAALYHLQLAAELDPLDTRAAYEIVKITARELAKRPSQKRREQYKMLLEHYAREFLKVPSAPDKMAFVRNARNFQ